MTKSNAAGADACDTLMPQATGAVEEAPAAMAQPMAAMELIPGGKQ